MDTCQTETKKHDCSQQQELSRRTRGTVGDSASIEELKARTMERGSALNPPWLKDQAEWRVVETNNEEQVGRTGQGCESCDNIDQREYVQGNQQNTQQSVGQGRPRPKKDRGEKQLQIYRGLRSTRHGSSN